MRVRSIRTQAALASAASFAVTAAIPLLVAAVIPDMHLIPSVGGIGGVAGISRCAGSTGRRSADHHGCNPRGVQGRAGDGRHRGYREPVRDRYVSGALAKLREARAGLTWSFSVRNNMQFMSEPEPEVNFAANPVDLIRHLLTNLPTNCKY